jgi:hypothetical protein
MTTLASETGNPNAQPALQAEHAPTSISPELPIVQIVGSLDLTTQYVPQQGVMELFR